jgi:transmembrane protein EpsG
VEDERESRMTPIYVLLVFVFVLAGIARSPALARVPGLPNTQLAAPDKLLTAVIIAAFVLLSGLRRNIGDTYFYMYTYTLNDFTWDYVMSKKEMGFGLLQMFLQQLTKDPQILIFTCALITNVLIIVVLRKYSSLFELSVYVYITSGVFMTSMNGMRQFLAAAIIFAATSYLLKGNWKLFMATVLLASMIHESALILIPIYFLVRRKAWTRLTFLLLAVSVGIVIGFNQFMNVLFTVIQDTSYAAEYKDFHEQGANVIRVIVDAVPLAIAYLGRDKLRSLYEHSDIIVNICVVNLLFMVIATQNWIFARFCIYFELYNLILISWLIKLFVAKDRKLIYSLIVMFYAFFFFYENAIVLKIAYKSNYFG